MPKILMVNTTRGYIGGVERLLVQMAKGFREHGWAVYGLFERSLGEKSDFDDYFDEVFVCETRELGELILHFMQLGIDRVCFHKVNHYEWVRDLQTCFPSAVLVHDHDYYCLRRHKYFPFNRKNCVLPFSPLYCSLCSGLLEKDKGRIRKIRLKNRILLLKYIRKCKLSFVLSGFMEKNLIMNGWQAESIRKIIPAQQTTELSASVDKERKVILYVGQLVRGKGVDLLIRALSLLSTDFEALILGRGNDENYLKKLASKLNMNNKVKFIGFTNQVSEIYQKADIVVVPSRWQEPFGLIGLEAFSHAKPVAAFRVGGIGEWLKHRENGTLVEPGNVTGLARAITELVSVPDLCRKYGLAGYELVNSKYNTTAFYNSIYQPMIDIKDGK